MGSGARTGTPVQTKQPASSTRRFDEVDDVCGTERLGPMSAHAAPYTRLNDAVAAPVGSELVYNRTNG